MDRRNKNFNGGRPNRNPKSFVPNEPERDVINPYTFIPVSEKAPCRKAVEFGDLSGYIDCTIKIQSPVFIPNSSGEFSDETMPEHKHRVFFFYEDLSEQKKLTDAIRMPQMPIVPGSEIRGMLRNVYEQLTNSCYVHIDENNLPFKRSAEPKELCLLVWDEASKGWRIYADVERNVYKGAIIHKNGGMVLENTFKGRYDIDDQYRKTYSVFDTAESYRVSFDPKNKTISKDAQGAWFVHIPSKMKTKMGGTWTANRQIVYTAQGLSPEKGVLLSDEVMQRFQYVLGMCENVKGGYMDGSFNKSGDSKTRTAIYAKRYRQKLPLIVYADKNSVQKNFTNDIIYLSPASMTKEFFGQTILSILEKNAEHQKCESRDAACPACRLFGMIGEKNSLRGKIRVSDGQPKEYQFGHEITLPILATPKISATEFYLKKPGSMQEDGVWTYDYYTTYRGSGRNISFIRHPYVPTLAGRKVYWTHKPTFKSEEKTKMNSSVTPIVSGSFSFRLYFDRLTAEEMEQLLFSIELSKRNGEEKACHKIGGGKPLGWGAVQVTADQITCFSYQMQNGKIERAEKAYVRNEHLRAAIESTKEAEQILCYAQSKGVDSSMVRYPARMNRNGERKIFEWFSKNRGSISMPKIRQVLPTIDDKNNKLKE